MARDDQQWSTHGASQCDCTPHMKFTGQSHFSNIHANLFQLYRADWSFPEFAYIAISPHWNVIQTAHWLYNMKFTGQSPFYLLQPLITVATLCGQGSAHTMWTGQHTTRKWPNHIASTLTPYTPISVSVFRSRWCGPCWTRGRGIRPLLIKFEKKKKKKNTYSGKNKKKKI